MRLKVAALAYANNALCAGFPIESRGYDLTLANIVLASLTLPAIALRCYSRYVIARELWWDDWTIIIAGVRAIQPFVLSYADASVSS
jgi:hypothetical protein